MSDSTDVQANVPTARIGRFTVRMAENIYCDEPIVEFMLADGRTFGSLRLSVAKEPIVVDLYESAMWRLLLPLNFNVDDYCLNADEMTELKEWANGFDEQGHPKRSS